MGRPNATIPALKERNIIAQGIALGKQNPKNEALKGRNKS